MDSDLDAIGGSGGGGERHGVEAHEARKKGGVRDEVLLSDGTVDGDESHWLVIVLRRGAAVKKQTNAASGPVRVGSC